jgi:hypothetical protein
MTADEFRHAPLSYESCRRSKYSLTFATDLYKAKNKTTEDDIESYLHLVDTLERYYEYRKAGEAFQKEATPLGERATPEVSITSELLVRKLQPWVESTRKELFDCSEPPFASDVEAVAWIENAANQACQLSSSKRQELYEIKCEIDAKNHEYLAYTGWDLLSEKKDRIVAYERPEGKGLKFIRLAQPDPHAEYPAAWSPLLTLDRTTERMTEVTGFLRPSLISYILTGKSPRLEPYTVSVHTIFHDLTGVLRRQLTLDCYIRDITYSDCRDIFRQIRKALNVTKKKAISDENQRFLDMIKWLGKPPQRNGATAYWEKFCLEWNRQRGMRQYGDANAPRMRYRRLMKKLNESYKISQL